MVEERKEEGVDMVSPPSNCGTELGDGTAPVIMHVAARFVRLRVPPMHRRRALSRNPCD